MDPASILSLIVVAVVAIFTSITAPMILSHRAERAHRQDQLEQYRREDLVAHAAAASSAALLTQQVRAAAEAAEQHAETAKMLGRIDAQADRIHTLVNSDMTAARQEEMDQAEATIVVLKRVIGVARKKHLPPDPLDLDALERATARRDQLEQILADRMHQLRETEDTMKLTEAGRNLDAEESNAGNREEAGDDDGTGIPGE